MAIKLPSEDGRKGNFRNTVCDKGNCNLKMNNVKTDKVNGIIVMIKKLKAWHNKC
jgi:hypothetical protein